MAAPTKSQSATKPKAPAKRGRPTKYRPEFAEQARKLCLMGLTDAELADFFGLNEVTINRWKRTHPDFCKSILAGKILADADVADSLYQSAVGGHFISEERPVGGDGSPISVQELKRQVAPSVQAQSLWLRNRQPHLWRDRVEVKADVSIDPFPPKEVLDALYAKSLKAAKERDEMLKDRRERLGIGFNGREDTD